MSKFLDSIKERARSDKKTIVLPESMDRRTWEAAETVLKEDIANIVIIGTPEEIAANGEGLDISKADSSSAFFDTSREGKTCCILIAGDRGLAGGYNSNIFKLVASQDADKIIPVGKRACDRYGCEPVMVETFSYDNAVVIAKEICEDFKKGMYEKVGIVSTKYVSMMTQNEGIEWILPISKTEKKAISDIIYEPDERTILEAVIEEYVAGKIVGAAKESFTCEVVARRFAMDNAGKNAGEMIDSLKLQYNRARQGAITQEITEIVAGSGM